MSKSAIIKITIYENEELVGVMKAEKIKTFEAVMGILDNYTAEGYFDSKNIDLQIKSDDYQGDMYLICSIYYDVNHKKCIVKIGDHQDHWMDKEDMNLIHDCLNYLAGRKK